MHCYRLMSDKFWSHFLVCFRTADHNGNQMYIWVMNLSQQVLLRTCYLLVEWQAISFYGVWLHLSKPVFIPWDVLITSHPQPNLDLDYSNRHEVLLHRLSLHWHLHLLFWVEFFNTIAPIRFLSSRIGISTLSIMDPFFKNLLYLYFRYMLGLSDLLCKLERNLSLDFTFVSEICPNVIVSIKQFIFFVICLLKQIY